jgi:hypothetical protein
VFQHNGVTTPLTPGRLSALARAASADGAWRELVRYSASGRWYQRMEAAESHEMWLLSWLPGQGTGFHDHLGSAGVVAVVRGELTERTPRPGSAVTAERVVGAGELRSFGPRHVHDVVNASSDPAVSIHAYSPPLAGMRRYQMTGSGLMLTALERAGVGW